MRGSVSTPKKKQGKKSNKQSKPFRSFTLRVQISLREFDYFGKDSQSLFKLRSLEPRRSDARLCMLYKQSNE